MGKIIADILAAIGSFLNDFIGATLGKLIFVPMIKVMLGDGPGNPGFVNSLYNSMMMKANGFLQVSPDEWAGGLGWQFINSIQAAFISVGAAFVLVFWLVGLCTDSLDIRSNLRLEVVLKQLTKLVVAEFLVVNSVDLISAFFKLPQALCNVMVGNAQFNINTSDAVYRCLESPSFSDATILWLFSLVLMVLTAISGGSIIYLAIIRIFKVLMIIPYAAIATSTVASSHGIASTTISYYKYAFATILESATMLIAVNLSGYLITNNSDLLTTLINGSDFNEALSWMIGTMMLLACTMGAVKEAGQITHRVLGT